MQLDYLPRCSAADYLARMAARFAAVTQARLATSVMDQGDSYL